MVYNHFNPTTPLPVQGGDSDVIRKTAENVGGGMTVKQAWEKATDDVTQVPAAQVESNEPANDSN